MIGAQAFRSSRAKLRKAPYHEPAYSMNASRLPPDDPALRRFLRDLWAQQHHVSWVQYVDTQSMAPSLQGPVELLVAWGARPSLRPGDLVVFEDVKLNVLVAHRVCQVEGSQAPLRVLQTGDRLLRRGIPGGWIGPETLFGRVIALRLKPHAPSVVRLHHGFIQKLGQIIARSSGLLWQSTQEPNPPTRFLSCRRLVHRGLCLAYWWALFLSQEKPDDLSFRPPLLQKS